MPNVDVLSIIGRASNANSIFIALEGAIHKGLLEPGHVLPPVRELAKSTGLSPNTIASSYKKLKDAGLLRTDGRRGSRVTVPIKKYNPITKVPKGIIDLATGNLDRKLLPEVTEELSHMLVEQNGYDHESDHPPLINTFSDWCLSQGVPVQETNINHGTLDAIEKALRVVVRPGVKILVEDPCWPPLLALIKNMGAVPSPLSLDDEGAMPPSTRAVEEAKAIILTPRAQNPTGLNLSRRRWSQIVRALDNNPRLLVIIDDFWGPISRAPLVDVQRLVNPWVYTLSLSKFLGPDLRLSLSTGTSTIMAQSRELHKVTSRWSSIILQKLGHRLWEKVLENGFLKDIQEGYSHKRHSLLEALEHHSIHYIGDQDSEGLHVWIPVGQHQKVVSKLLLNNWAVSPGEDFCIESPEAIRISTGNLELGMIGGLARDLSYSFRE